MLVSLHTQTLLHHLTIQVLNTSLIPRYMIHFSDFSLHTQTVLHHLTIQVLNTRV